MRACARARDAFDAASTLATADRVRAFLQFVHGDTSKPRAGQSATKTRRQRRRDVAPVRRLHEVT